MNYVTKLHTKLSFLLVLISHKFNLFTENIWTSKMYLQARLSQYPYNGYNVLFFTNREIFRSCMAGRWRN